MNFQEILTYNFIDTVNFQLNLLHLIAAVTVILSSQFFLWMIKRALARYSKQKKVDEGRRYAIIQFTKYVIYTLTILLAIEAMGVKLSVLWGGAAALLVGVGLGLQQTFNDLISGIILLIEGTIEVGDILELNGQVGVVTKIGIRTSKIETRSRISLLIPNSKLVGDNVTNWTHNNKPSRFQVSIGVAYSSDVELVIQLIMQAANEHALVLKTPVSEVQVKAFGNSSLDFELYFFSEEYLRIEFVKSELRKRIIQLFRLNKIEIPFPQQDIWLRNTEVLRSLSGDAES